MLSVLEKYQLKVDEEELFRHLREVELFAGLSESNLRTVMKSLEASEFKRKQWIFKQGDLGDRFYVIAAGEAVVLREADGGFEEELASLEQWKCFGERALLTAEKRFAGVRVKSPTLRTLSIDKAEFERVLGPLSEFVRKVEYKAPEPRKLIPKGRFSPGGMQVAGKKVSVAMAFQNVPALKKFVPRKEKAKWQPLIEASNDRPDVPKGHKTFEEVQQTDKKRKKLLALARDVSPMDSILMFSALPSTIIPRIAVVSAHATLSHEPACHFQPAGIHPNLTLV